MSSEFFDEDDCILSFGTQGGIPLDKWITQVYTDCSQEGPFCTFPDGIASASPQGAAYPTSQVSAEDLKMPSVEVPDFENDNSSFESDLLLELFEKECKLDSLNEQVQADKTMDGTHTVVRRFNRFWVATIFDPVADQFIHHLKTKFSVERVCQASHCERNIILSNYVPSVKPKAANGQSEGPKKTYMTGGAKQIYLFSIQRALKLHEKQYKLVATYGSDWSLWDDVEYEQMNALLDQTIMMNEFGNVQDLSSTIMSKEQFEALHEHTWMQATDMSLWFAKRLKHKPYYLL